jgi:hypothetical protein
MLSPSGCTEAGALGQGVAHSQCIEAWLMSVPGLKIVAPSTPADAYGLMKTALRAAFLCFTLVGRFAFAASESLPQTNPLDWPDEDLSARMMDGAHRFVEKQMSEAKVRRAKFWNYDNTSAQAWEKSVDDNRKYFQQIIGAVDPRLDDGAGRGRLIADLGRLLHVVLRAGGAGAVHD